MSLSVLCKKEEIMKTKITALITGLMLFAAMIPSAAMAAESSGKYVEMIPTKIYQGKEHVPKISGTISDSDPILFDGYRGKIYQVPFTESGLIDVKIGNVRGTGSLNVAYGKKENLSDKWEEQLKIENGLRHNLQLSSAKAGEQLYIAICSKAPSFQVSFDLEARLYPAADRTIRLNTTEYLGVTPIAKSQTYRFTAKETGYIKVNYYTGEEDATFALLDNNKKQISKNIARSYDGGLPLYFGVKKGTTYYLRLKNVQDQSGTGPYRLYLRNTNTKKKSVSIKRNKKIKGYVLSGKKGHDWYKVKVKKSGKVKFYLKNYMSGQCYIDLYNKKGKKVKSLRQKTVDADGYIESKTKYGRLSKGTYYIKIYTKDKRESGAYTLKWK